LTEAAEEATDAGKGIIIIIIIIIIILLILDIEVLCYTINIDIDYVILLINHVGKVAMKYYEQIETLDY
jgi:hypothetical protein